MPQSLLPWTVAFTDDVRRLADPAAAPLVRPSRGTHVVLDRRFLASDAASYVTGCCINVDGGLSGVL